MIIGVDPSKSYMGMAVIDAAPGQPLPHVPPGLVELQRIRPGGSHAAHRRAVEALLEAGRRWRPSLWGVEVVPKKLRQDQHRSHASGAGPSWWGGGAMVASVATGADWVELQSSTWRGRMRQLHRRWRGETAPAPAPRRRVPDVSTITSTEPVDNFAVRVHRSCGHSHQVARAALWHGAPVPPCPVCTVDRKVVTADRRDRLKAEACAFVATHWPETYARLVEGARASSRKEGAPDHHLAGVSDACEAVGIACALLTTNTAEAA